MVATRLPVPLCRRDLPRHRRPVIDNVHGAPQPQDELGPGMLVPRLWSPDSCLDTRQTRFLSKAVSARAAGYTPGRKRGPEREGIGRNDAGRPPGKGPGFAPGTFPREASGGIAEPLLGEASGEAANRSEVATNSSTSLAMCALTKSRAKKWYNSRGPRGGGTGEIPPRGPLWAGALAPPQARETWHELTAFCEFFERGRRESREQRARRCEAPHVNAPPAFHRLTAPSRAWMATSDTTSEGSRLFHSAPPETKRNLCHLCNRCHPRERNREHQTVP